MRVARFSFAVLLLCALPAPARPPRVEERPGAAAPSAPAPSTASVPGDVNGDSAVDVRDVFHLLNYLFAGGGAPLGPADANGDGAIDVQDAFVLLNFLFAGGSAPVPDTTPPRILLTDPYAWAPAVPLNASCLIEFSEPMNVTTLVAANLPFRDLTANADVPGEYGIEAGGRIVRFTPFTGLAAKHTYALFPTYPALLDLAGNPLQIYEHQDYDSGGITFEAGLSADQTPPSVVATFPEEGATGLPTNVAFVVNLTETVRDIDITHGITVDGTRALGALQYGTSRQFLLTLPPLAPAATHTLRIDGLVDLAGNAMSAPFELHFSTAGGPDLDPLVFTMVPSGGETGVSTDAHLRAVFSKPVNPLAFQLRMRIDYGSSSLPIDSTASLDVSRTWGRVVPADPLLPSTRYILLPTAVDVSGHGNYGSTGFSRFKTGSGPSSPPAFVRAVPANGAAGVPVNTRTEILYTGSVDVSTLSAVSLTANGAPAPVSVTKIARDGVLTLSHVALSPSTVYTLSAAGVKDETGVAFAPFTSTFTTRADATPDTTRPVLVSTSPADGQTGVDPAAPIVMTFSEPMDPSTVTPAYLFAWAGGSWPGTFTTSGAVVTFTPLLPFPPGHLVEFGTHGCASDTPLDWSGNATPCSVSRSFTTSGTDGTRPVVTSFSFDGSSATFQFSEPIAPASLEGTPNGIAPVAVYANGQRVSSSGGAFSADHRAWTLTLFWGGPMTIVLTDAITDCAGNPLVPYVATFERPPDGVWSPTRWSFRPEPAAAEVPPDSPITIFLPNALDASERDSAVVTADGAWVPGSFTLAADRRTWSFLPDSPLGPGASVEIFLPTWLLSADGYHFSLFPDTHVSFRTASAAASRGAIVLASTPTRSADVPTNARLAVRYDEDLDASSVSGDSVTLTSAGSPVAGTASLEGARDVVFTPAAPLAPDTAYAFRVDGVRDADGGVSDPFSHDFTTGPSADGVAPALLEISPAAGDTVGVESAVWMRFSEPLDALRARDVLTLTNAAGTVPTRVTIDEDGKRVRLTPLGPLVPGSACVVHLAGAADEAGNAGSIPPVGFTAGTGVDGRRPIARLTVPPDARLPTNAPARFAFDRDVNPVSLDAQTHVETGDGAPVAGSLALDPSRRLLTFTPAAPWAPFSYYRLVFGGSALVSTSGAPVIADDGARVDPIYSFMTGDGTETGPPQMLATTPSDGFSGAPRDVRPAVLFDRAIDTFELSAKVSLDGPDGSVPIVLTLWRRTLTAAPVVPLTEPGAYTLTVHEAKSLSGEPLAAPVVVHFDVGDFFQLAPARRVQTQPAPGATGVSVTAPIVLVYDQPIAPTSVSDDLVTLEDTGPSGARVPVTFSVSADGRTVTVQPVSPLAPSTGYDLSTEIWGLSGLDVAWPSYLSFQTAP